MKAYCFVPEERIEEITECGMELSVGERYACKVTSNDGRCFVGRLNPRDFDKADFLPGKKLVKINLAKVRSFIGEGVYLDIDSETGSGMFEDSLLPSKEYQLGMYRKPVCLIVNTVLPEAVEKYDSLMDEAVPYVNSEELYIEYLFNNEAEKNENFREVALAACFDKLAENNMVEKKTYGDYILYNSEDTSYIVRKG